MKKLNELPLIPLISAFLALVAIIVVIVLLVGGSGEKGIYLSEVSGDISITDTTGEQTNAIAGTMLKQGDIITIGNGSSCKLDYKVGKSDIINSIMLDENTQVLLTDEFTGSGTSEIYLGRGTLITNLMGNEKASVKIRTANAMVYTDKTVSKVQYETNGFDEFTHVYTFMGQSRIQLFDEQGNEVNNQELLGEKYSAEITTNDLGPMFTYLNAEFSLNELTSWDIKKLVTIANLIEEFPYEISALQEIYGMLTSEQTQPPVPEETMTETEVPDSSEDIQKPDPLETTAETTTPITVKPPSKTTTAYVPPATTTETTTTAKPTGENVIVILKVGSEESICEVEYGGDLKQPEDPVLDGMKFIKWDKSFKNITENITITAIFEEDSTSGQNPDLDDGMNVAQHTVKIVIGNNINMIVIANGEKPNLPDYIPEQYEIEGMEFVGWDRENDPVYEDITITALFEPLKSKLEVTFIIMGNEFIAYADRGQSVIPPVNPPAEDMHGRKFSGWDKSLNNITEDQTITAVYGEESYTVVFIIDGESYSIEVENGKSAVPPVTPPMLNSDGEIFVGWDGDIFLINSDRIIRAVYE